jgi:hypothetical protein
MQARHRALRALPALRAPLLHPHPPLPLRNNREPASWQSSLSIARFLRG